MRRVVTTSSCRRMTACQWIQWSLIHEKRFFTQRRHCQLARITLRRSRPASRIQIGRTLANLDGQRAGSLRRQKTCRLVVSSASRRAWTGIQTLRHLVSQLTQSRQTRQRLRRSRLQRAPTARTLRHSARSTMRSASATAIIAGASLGSDSGSTARQAQVRGGAHVMISTALSIMQPGPAL